MTPGPLALSGGGEFLHGTRDADGHILAAVSGDQVGVYAPDETRRDAIEEPARAHFESIGASVRFISEPHDLADLRFIHVADAAPLDLSAQLVASGMWRELVNAWIAGAGVTFAGGAATVVGASIPLADQEAPPGLGLIPEMAFIPQSDSVALERRLEFMTSLPDHTTLVGLDDQTSAIWQGGSWIAWGPGTVNIYFDSSERDYGPGDVVGEITAPIID